MKCSQGKLARRVRVPTPRWNQRVDLTWGPLSPEEGEGTCKNKNMVPLTSDIVLSTGQKATAGVLRVTLFQEVGPG